MKGWRRSRELLILAMLLAAGTTAAPAEDRYDLIPVLFVHGHGLYSSDWDPLMEAMRVHGYPRDYLLAVQIEPNTMANVAAAEQVIAPAAETLLARASEAARRAGQTPMSPTKIHVVSHSMGAVSSRWYASRLRPDRVAVWLGVAGSNHGTNALCPYHDEAAREMCPAFATDPERGAVQLALNGRRGDPKDETPYGLGADPDGVERIAPDDARSIAYFTIRIEPDEWIRPARSALLQGAGGVNVELPDPRAVRETGEGNFLFVADFGWLDLRALDHMTLLEHPRFHELVVTLLQSHR